MLGSDDKWYNGHKIPCVFFVMSSSALYHWFLQGSLSHGEPGSDKEHTFIILPLNIKAQKVPLVSETKQALEITFWIIILQFFSERSYE